MNLSDKYSRQSEITAAWLIILLGLIYVPIGALAAGYTVSTLWRWFVVPSLHLPALSWGYAYGIMLLVQVFRFQMRHEDYENRSNEETLHRLARTAFAHLISYAVALAIGYIVVRLFL